MPGCLTSYDAVRRRERQERDGKEKKHYDKNTRGDRQNVYSQFGMCRQDEQPMLDHTRLRTDGSGPAFSKPSEFMETEVGKAVVVWNNDRH